MAVLVAPTGGWTPFGRLERPRKNSAAPTAASKITPKIANASVLLPDNF
jgi:hypothetical protein